jgi:hypothetical protein
MAFVNMLGYLTFVSIYFRAVLGQTVSAAWRPLAKQYSPACGVVHIGYYYSSRHQIAFFKAAEGHHPPPPYSAAARQRAASCELSSLAWVRCLCCNIVRLCCGLEACDLVTATSNLFHVEIVIQNISQFEYFLDVLNSVFMDRMICQEKQRG